MYLYIGKKNKLLDARLIIYYLFLIYPTCFLVGNLIINSFTFLISFIYIIVVFKDGIKKSLNNKNFFLLLFLFVSYLVNLYFSQNIENSYPKVIKFFFIIFFILAFIDLNIYFKNFEINRIYKFWGIIFLIVTFDIIFEFLIGFNSLGLKSYMPGRIASFTGDELVIGSFFLSFVLIILSYITNTYTNKKYLIYCFSVLFIFTSLTIGERSNFIKTLIIISIFIFFFSGLSGKFKFFSFLSIIIIITLTIFTNVNYKTRFYNVFYASGGINKFLNNSQYGAHYNVAKEIYLDNKLFGIGIKNFREESGSKKYDNLNHPMNNQRWGTHPHQIHFQFLSETGIFGYICFLIFIITSFYFFIKNFISEKNLYCVSGFLFVLASLIPFLPSGSFFSTYYAGFFWLNYSLMMSKSKAKS